MSSSERAAFFATAIVLASWLPCALALDRDGAIDAARRQVKSHCTSETACSFTARVEKDKWYVRVEYPGGHAIFILDQTGKIVGRMEGRDSQQ
jgi:hypothetical protein